MARPKKKGVDYFPHDIGMSNDPKIEMLEAECGLVGYAIYCKLLEKIYSTGYFTEFSDREIKVFARKNHIDLAEVESVVKVCIEEGLFDSKQYRKYSVLTSIQIQKRYAEICKRRVEIELDKKHLLVSSVLFETENIVYVAETQVNVAETQVNVNSSTQSESESIYSRVVNYLNEKTASNYKHTSKKTQSLIDARVREGFTQDNFVEVIDKKASQWLDTEHAQYLRPETLFGTKFESYLNQPAVIIGGKSQSTKEWQSNPRSLLGQPWV